MLYLMMDKTDKEYLVKVGFSDRQANLANRRRVYYGYNPRAIMRSTCAGNTEMEKGCRADLVEWGGTRIKGTEWFVVPADLFWSLYEQGMRAFRPRHNPIHFVEEF